MNTTTSQILSILMALFAGPSAAYQFWNPVLPGDNPDQNVYVDGEWFYRTGSSFHMTPNVEIDRSHDLVHWETVSRAGNADWNGLNGSPGAGAWGGFVFKRGGTWWAYSCYNWGQKFMTANSIEGPWSDPTACAGAGGYDNSVFVDSDGKIYMVMKGGYGANGFNAIQEIGTDGNLTGTALNLSWINLDSTTYGWAEGPTICKRNGWYYYFASTTTSCGGEMFAWRSKTLTGEKSSWEALGAVLQADAALPWGGPQHSTAPIPTSDGRWWILYHSYDCSRGWDGMGRQSLLAEVTWPNDKPAIGAGKPVAFGSAPALSAQRVPFKMPRSDDFSSTTLKPFWTFFGKTSPTLYSLTDNPGWLRLNPVDSFAVVQREALHTHAISVKLNFAPRATGIEAGLRIAWADNISAIKLAKIWNGSKEQIRFAYGSSSSTLDWTAGSTVWLRMDKVDHKVSGWASADRKTWIQVGSGLDISSLDRTSSLGGAWTGTAGGIYAVGASADFDDYAPRDGLVAIPASDANASLGAAKPSGTTLIGATTGDWVGYGGIDLGQSGVVTHQVVMSVASADSGVSIDVVLDDPDSGRTIATVAVPNTGSTTSWKTVGANVIAASGQHDVYLKIHGGNASIAWFRFDKDFLPATKVASFYNNISYDALEAQLPMGSYTLAQLTVLGFQDNSVSSMKVDSGLIVELFDGDNFQTPLGTYTADQPNFITLGINDNVTSIRITQATTAIRDQGPRKTTRTRWSQGTLILPETEYFGSAQYKSGKLQIIDSRGRSRVVEVAEGKAYIGRLPAGVYQAKVLDGKSSAFRIMTTP